MFGPIIVGALVLIGEFRFLTSIGIPTSFNGIIVVWWITGASSLDNSLASSYPRYGIELVETAHLGLIESIPSTSFHRINFFASSILAIAAAE